MNKSNVIYSTLAGTLICAVFALLFFRISFLDIDRPPLYVLALGFIGSLTLALFRQSRIRDGIYANIMFYFIFALLVATRIRPIAALILLPYLSGMVAALYIHVKMFEPKISDVPGSRPLLLASQVGLMFIAATVVHGFMFISGFTSTFLLANLPVGFLVGLGQGLGVELVERWQPTTAIEHHAPGKS